METYVADGFDSFEECLNHEIVEDDGTAAALKAGLDVMYRAAQERIDEHFGRFAEHASSTCFAVPKELLQAQDLAENLPSCSAEEERTLDEQLRDLRKRLAHADAMRSHCDAQSDALEAEMADHASVVEQLRAGKENAVLASVKGGKRGVESAAAAIVAAARQLQPLLEQAEEMQRRGVALSEDVGVMPGRRRRHGGEGGDARALRERDQSGGAQVHQLTPQRQTRGGAGGGGRGGEMMGGEERSGSGEGLRSTRRL